MFDVVDPVAEVSVERGHARGIVGTAACAAVASGGAPLRRMNALADVGTAERESACWGIRTAVSAPACKPLDADRADASPAPAALSDLLGDHLMTLPGGTSRRSRRGTARRPS